MQKDTDSGFPVLIHVLSRSFLPRGILPQVSEVWFLGTSLPLCILAGKHAMVVWVAFAALENKSLNHVAFFFLHGFQCGREGVVF